MCFVMLMRHIRNQFLLRFKKEYITQKFSSLLHYETSIFFWWYWESFGITQGLDFLSTFWIPLSKRNHEASFQVFLAVFIVNFCRIYLLNEKYKSTSRNEINSVRQSYYDGLVFMYISNKNHRWASEKFSRQLEKLETLWNDKM